jgi:lipid-binding SYLF domain-containing protein
MKNRMLTLLLVLAIAIPSIATAQEQKTTDPNKTQNTQAQTSTVQKEAAEHHSESSESSKKISDATVVVLDFAHMKEGPPRGLVEKAAAIVVIPKLVKAGFIAGAKHGEGVLTARDASGNWSEPVFVNISGGSVGFQAGVSETDLVLLLMRDRNVDEILNGEFTLGGEAQVAAGPVGRDASAGADTHFDAAIYSYSRSKGIFAGISIDGSKLYLDKNGNASFYGATDDAHARIKMTPAAGSPGAQLAQALNELTGKQQAGMGAGTSGSK